MTRVLLHFVLLGSLAGLGASTASAQPGAPSKIQLAKQYTDAGLAAQRSGDYDTAITLYQKAYEQVAHPTLIFDMAQAHRLAGREAEALRLYRKYLSEAATGPHAQEARDRIADIEAARTAAARKAVAQQRAEEEREAAQARKADAERKAAEARNADEER